MTGFVFDLGGVLTQCDETDRIRELSARYGIGADGLARLGDFRKLCDDGELTRKEMFALAFPSLSPEDAEDLADADLESYLVRNEEEVARIRSVKAEGAKVAVVSSVGKENAPAFRGAFSDVFALCDAVILSCETGLSKPSRGLVYAVCGRLGVPVDRTLWIDDDRRCLDVAEACGAKTELYRRRKDNGTESH